MEYCNAVVWQEQASDRGDAWDAVASAVRYAKDNLIPIVIENLDLDKKNQDGSKKPIERSR